VRTPEPHLPSSPAVGPVSTTPSERVIVTVVHACRQAGAPTSELRDAVFAHVRELKKRGYPPERVLISLKELIARAGIKKIGPLADRGSSTVSTETRVVDQVIAWCIDDYYFVPADATRRATAGDDGGGSEAA